MPRIRRIIPELGRNGPTLSIRVEPVLAVQEQLRADGTAAPSASILALVDTGANGTLVRTDVLNGLGIQPGGTVFLNTASTIEPIRRSEYRVRVVFGEGIAVETDVVEGPFGGQNVQCLIRRDILERCILTYNGPKQRYPLNVLPEQE